MPLSLDRGHHAPSGQAFELSMQFRGVTYLSGAPNGGVVGTGRPVRLVQVGTGRLVTSSRVWTGRPRPTSLVRTGQPASPHRIV